MEEDKSITSKIFDQLKPKLVNVFSWIESDEGKIIANVITSLGSYVVGDPTGLLFPTILNCTDYGIRKKVLKHFPDIMEKLNNEQALLNMEFIRSELGQQLLRDTFNAIIKETEEEKITKLKSFLISAYKQEKPDNLFIRSCYRHLMLMDVIHIQILAIFNNPESVIRKICEERIESDARTIKIPDDLNPFFLKMDENIYSNVIKELENWDILNGIRNSSTGGLFTAIEVEQRILPEMTRYMKERITNYGKRLIELIECK